MKTLNFVFKSDTGFVIKRDSINIDTPTSWNIIEAEFEKFLDKHVDSITNKTAASILISRWMSSKEFPNGQHFFIKDSNEFGFSSAYLYKE